MNIRVIHEKISLDDVQTLAKEIYIDLVKGVADVERDIIVLGGEWHMDASKVLIESGSQQENIWGFNIYPEEKGEAALEFVSLINIRPAQGNREMELKDEVLRQKIRTIVTRLIPDLFV